MTEGTLLTQFRSPKEKNILLPFASQQSGVVVVSTVVSDDVLSRGQECPGFRSYLSTTFTYTDVRGCRPWRNCGTWGRQVRRFPTVLTLWFGCRPHEGLDLRSSVGHRVSVTGVRCFKCVHGDRDYGTDEPRIRVSVLTPGLWIWVFRGIMGPFVHPDVPARRGTPVVRSHVDRDRDRPDLHRGGVPSLIICRSPGHT